MVESEVVEIQMGKLSVRSGLVCTVTLFLLLGVAPRTDAKVLDNVVTDWNYVLQQIVRSNGISSQIASRYFALVHLAQYSALKHTVAIKGLASSQEYIAASAAHIVLSSNFPVLQSGLLDAVLKKYALKAKLSVADAIRLQRITQRCIKPLLCGRVLDGTQTWAFFTPSPPNGPAGVYQFTPNQTFAVYPQLGSSRPFVVKDLLLLDKQGGPLKLGTALYDAQLKEVERIGNSTNDPSFKDTARFWADGATTAAIPGHMYNISVAVLPANLDILTTAKLFALQGVSSFDASVAAYNQKYKYLFWRPITAINQGDAQHPPRFFRPFLATPPHPEYPSGHSASTGSQIGIIARYLKIKVTDPLKFTIGTEFPGLAPRTYTSLYAMGNEVGISRIYGGIHFRKSVDDGLTVGLKTANYVYDNFDKYW